MRSSAWVALICVNGAEKPPLAVRIPGIPRRKLIYNQIFKLAFASCLVDRTMILKSGFVIRETARRSIACSTLATVSPTREDIFATAIKHHPCIRLTIRQRTRVLQQFPKTCPAAS